MYADTPTFLSSNGGSSCIDLVICSNNLVNNIKSIVTDNEVELFSGAPLRGHVPVITSLNCRNNPALPHVEKICLKNINWREWSRDLERAVEVNTEYINNTDSPYDLIEFMDNAIATATEKHGSKKKSSCHSKPYWNKTLSELSAKLRRDRKNYIKRNTDRNKESLEASKQKFDEAREKACKDFIIKKTSNLNAVQSQKFWKEFKKIFSVKT